MEEENIITEEQKELPQESSYTSPIPVIPQLSVALMLLTFVFGVTYVSSNDTVTKKETSPDVRVANVVPVPRSTQSLAQVFQDVEIEAGSAFVWDVKTQRILFNKNADEERPLASITKLMTTLISYELLDPEEQIAISNDSLRAEGDSGFRDGEQFSMQSLSDLTLISSSNDGATALGRQGGSIIDSQADAEAIFVEAMNVRAKELGLTKTRFKNSTGLDISETEAGAYGSARDVALLMEYIITHARDAIALTTTQKTSINNSNGEYHTAKNTNTVVSELEGLMASKTGYTALSGGNLVVAVNMGLDRPVIVAVLGSTQEGRFTDIKTLTDRARLYIQNQAQ